MGIGRGMGRGARRTGRGGERGKGREGIMGLVPPIFPDVVAPMAGWNV